MRKLAPLLLLLAACTRSSPPPREESDVRCTLVGLAPAPGADPDAPAGARTWIARFRVVHGGPTPIVHRGYTPDGPLFQEQVLRDGAWRDVPIRWCGTGLVERSLACGAEVEVEFALAPDKQTHRFRFGEPVVATPPVSAPP
jgi:hypothetical protein